MAVRSFELGLSGQCDVVEFHLGSALASGAEARASRSLQEIIPLEYKRGKPKAHATDEVQLCAEEMLNVHIERGMLYYGKPLRRTYVPFHPPLQELTRETARPLHALIESRETPSRTRRARENGRASRDCFIELNPNVEFSSAER
ncbi:MAG: Dna2/Cas4 domain-containing protein [Chthoniobacterales bacterium]|nr:Dna2/Cas4 domain-containing protein [Chthoniobacterales bacterium]